MKYFWAGLLAVFSLGAQTKPLSFLNHNLPVLDAHNCYPYEGRWADRIDRALKTGVPVGIEQDLAWYVDAATKKGRIVVSHTSKTTGFEPALRDYFFERVRPLVEKALAENDQSKWPLIALHFDFKSNEPALHEAVWDLLGEYQGWITTAVKGANPSELAPFEAKPLLVMTEDSDAQEKVFFDRVSAGSRLRFVHVTSARRLATPAIDFASTTSNAIASSTQSWLVPSAFCVATVSVYSCGVSQQ